MGGGQAHLLLQHDSFTRLVMSRLILSFLGLLAASTLTAAPATAAQCAAHEDFTKALADHFKESRSALGLSGQSHVVELFVSPSGSWTILATDTQGRTCVVASGEAWQNAPKVLTGVDS
jgi:hypothetical protein